MTIESLTGALGSWVKLEKEEETQNTQNKRDKDSKVARQAQSTPASILSSKKTETNEDKLEISSNFDTKSLQEKEQNKDVKQKNFFEKTTKNIKKYVDNWHEKVNSKRESREILVTRYKNNPKELVSVVKKHISEDTEALSLYFQKNPDMINEFAKKLDQLPERLKAAFIHFLSQNNNEKKVSKENFSHIFSVLKAANTRPLLFGTAIASILESKKYTEEQRKKLISSLEGEEMAEAIKKFQKDNSVETQAAIHQMSNAKVENLTEEQETKLMSFCANCSHNDDKKIEAQNQAILVNSNIYKNSPKAQQAYAKSIKDCQHAESQIYASECITNSKYTKEETFKFLISEIKSFKEEAQNEVFRIINSSERVTPELKQVLEKEFPEKQLQAAHQTVQTDEIKLVHEEPRSIISLSGVLGSIKNVITTGIKNEFNKNKPTLHQFIDLLNNDVFTAEYVAKEGYKDILISQFSSLTGDMKEQVLKTLTDEDKIIMRKKGLLPRRFWDQADELVAKKALENNNYISDSDAELLVKIANENVLYKCLTKSSKISETNKELFKQTLIDNRFLKKDEFGRYRLA